MTMMMTMMMRDEKRNRNKIRRGSGDGEESERKDGDEAVHHIPPHSLPSHHPLIPARNDI